MSELNDARKANRARGGKSLIDQVSEQAVRVVRFEKNHLRDQDDDIVYKGMSIRFPQVVGADVLVIVRADINGSAVVAFTSGGSAWEAIASAFGKIENKSLKWKDDEYA